jgi:predicted GNAT family N-acyltransferase
VNCLACFGDQSQKPTASRGGGGEELAVSSPAARENRALVATTSSMRPARHRRQLSTASGRTDDGRVASIADARVKAPVIDVALCRDKGTLENAQRLRYEVYCLELGRQSPYADHDSKTIKDDLDSFGHTFVAVEDGETIGTLRTNFSTEGSLGAFEQLYGMSASKHHPGRTAICTKFIVKRSKRGSLAFYKLMIAWLEYITTRRALECYIDCTPNLVPFYERFGFARAAGAPFCHHENGLSLPMMLDLAQHGRSLCERFGAGDYRRANG